MISPLPGATPMKAGSATFPFFGVEPAVLDKDNAQEKTGNDVDGVLCFKQSFPGIARTIFGDHERYLKTYMDPFKGM